MQIEIQDPSLEARIKRQIEATGASSVEEALDRLLQTQEEQDRWLLENRGAIDAKILRGIEQLDRGEGIPGDEAWERLQQRKEAWLTQNPATAP
jgi:antitoxin ParD1/3/4